MASPAGLAAGQGEGWGTPSAIFAPSRRPVVGRHNSGASPYKNVSPPEEPKAIATTRFG